MCKKPCIHIDFIGLNALENNNQVEALSDSVLIRCCYYLFCQLQERNSEFSRFEG